jgi:hypothetical protein
MVAPVAAAAATNPWIAPAAIVGGSLLSGMFGKSSADREAEALRQSTAESRRQFDLQWGAQEPYRTAGASALGGMTRMLEGGMPAEELMRADPGYQFRLQQGTEGVQNMLSAQNRRLGGSGLRAMADYQQGAASQEFQNIFGRQGQVAGFGPPATQTPQNIIPQTLAAQGTATPYSAYNQAVQGGLQNYISYTQNRDIMNMLGNRGGGYAPGWQSSDPSVWG